MNVVELTVEDYQIARGELDQLCLSLGIWASSVPTGAIEHANAAAEILDQGTDHVPVAGILQSARNHLLIVRELLGEKYDAIPAPDKLIRHCDNALKGTPGEGEQTQRPYE